MNIKCDNIFVRLLEAAKLQCGVVRGVNVSYAATHSVYGNVRIAHDADLPCQRRRYGVGGRAGIQSKETVRSITNACGHKHDVSHAVELQWAARFDGTSASIGSNSSAIET